MRPAPGKSGSPSENSTTLRGASTRLLRRTCNAARWKNALKSVIGSSWGNHARRSAAICAGDLPERSWIGWNTLRSEEHTSELQSRLHLVCRLLLEKKTKHQ